MWEQNMTNQKCTEKALQESEERYRSIIEDQTELICRFLPDYTLTFVNTAYCRFFKRKKEELIGHSFMTLIPGGDQKKVKDQIASLSKERPVSTHEHQIFLPNGEIGFQQWTNRVVLGETGDIEEFQAAGRDITDRMLAEEALRRANDTLERLVEKRTARLLKINERLLKEIEERKKTEEALRSSEEKYRSVVDHIGVGISLISPDMEILTLNNQMKKWFPAIDVSEKPLCYKSFNDPPRETTCSYCPTLKTLQDGEVHESITETPAGNEIRHYRVIASPIKDRNGRVLSAIEMVDDFTEKIKVQERLQESEAKYRNLIENINDVIFSVDTRKCITYISPAVERFLRYRVNEIMGLPFTRFVHPDDLPALLFRFEKTLSGNLQPYEFRVFAKDGAIFHVRTSSRPLWDDDRLVGLTGVMTDISEFKRAEEALRESEQRLSDIIDFLPDATFAIDRDGKVMAWNRAIEEMTGVKTKDMTGKGDYEYALPFYGIRRPILIDMVFSSDEEIENKYSFIKKEKDIMLAEADVIMNGENRVLWGKARCLYDSKGNIVGAIQSIRDITDRRRAEEGLKKRERELEMKSRNLEELNTALRVLLKRREEDKSELEEKVLTNIKQLVLPYIEKMKMSRLEEKDMSYVAILESNLKDIVSPFSHRLSSKYLNLTPKELQVANLIREGRTTKEIAELLNASPGTIDFHRNNIRHKLDMKNKKANLRTYLLTVS
jgi:PAS domain S-box-containing protein